MSYKSLGGGLSEIQLYTIKGLGANKKVVRIGSNYRIPSVQNIMESPKELLDTLEIPETDRQNIYYTVCECIPESNRELEKQWYIPIDLDDVFSESGEDITDAKIRVVRKAVAEYFSIPIDDMFCVFTGGGLQFLLELSKPIEVKSFFQENRGAYKSLCEGLEKLLRQRDIECTVDPSVFSAARLLRYPETWNIKEKYKRFSKLINNNSKAYVLSKILQKKPEASGNDYVSHDFMKFRPAVDSDKIMGPKGCRFLHHVRDNPNEVSEPQWYASLSILGYMGEKVAHEVSEGYEGYNFLETQKKLEQAKAKSGPRTCHNISNLWDGCQECPHFGKEKSPILLRERGFIATKTTGFWEMTHDKYGRPKQSKPDYDGMIQHFINEKGEYKSIPSGAYVYLYDGKKYSILEKDFMRSFAYQEFNPKPGTAVLDEFYKRAVIEPEALRDMEWFGRSSRGYVNFENGIFDIRNRKLLNHSPDFGFTQVLGCSYDSEATCPNFDKFLDQITQGNKDLQQILMEFFAYSIFDVDSCKYQKSLIMLGGGSNGKSTLLDIFRKLLGQDSFSSLSLKDMRSEQNRFMLLNKLVNIAEENSYDSFKDAELVKNFITGGDITAKRVYMPPIQYKNTTKLIICCNELPYTKDVTDGFFRRFIIVPFREKFSLEKGNLDINILDKLGQELPGIFNKILHSYDRLEDRARFLETEETRSVLESYSQEAKVHALWYGENVYVAPNDDSGTSKDEIYQDYVDFFEKSGEPISKKISRIKLFKFLREKLGKDYMEHRKKTSVGYQRFVKYVNLYNNSY